MNNNTKTRPRTVTVTAALQLLIAAVFLIAPVLGFIFGADLQAAAEAEVIGQSLPATVLADHNIRFDESGIATMVPVAVALSVAVLAWLNLGGRRAGRILSLIVHPLLIALDAVLFASNSAAAQALESVLKSSGDPAVQNVDAQAILDAALHAYPAWVPALTTGRFIVGPLASLIVIVLLVLPSARVYFRKER